MDLTPCPFSLGTSRVGPEDIIPVEVSASNRANRRRITCNIKGLTYANVASDVKDRSYATVIYNKKTNALEMCYNLPEFLAPKIDVEIIDEENPRSLGFDRTSATTLFGSFWHKKYLREMDQMAAHSAAVKDASVLRHVAVGQSKLSADNKAASDEVDIKPSIGGMVLSQRELLLPPFDQQTKLLSQVFPIDKIVPSLVSASLNGEAKAIAGADDNRRAHWLKTEKYPRFILDRFVYLPLDNTENATLPTPGVKRKRKLGNIGDQPVSRIAASTNLALLAHMFKLFHLKPRELQQRTPLSFTPPSLAKHLLSEFTVQTIKGVNERSKVRIMTPTLRDKLIYYMLVLLLHCDNFSTVISTLPADFKISTERLKKYYYFMGCTVSKQEIHSNSDVAEEDKRYQTVARLSAPLVFKSSRSYKR